jgi:hypothetical protein
MTNSLRPQAQSSFALMQPAMFLGAIAKYPRGGDEIQTKPIFVKLTKCGERNCDDGSYVYARQVAIIGLARGVFRLRRGRGGFQCPKIVAESRSSSTVETCACERLGGVLVFNDRKVTI